jgi:peroxin-6
VCKVACHYVELQLTPNPARLNADPVMKESKLHPHPLTPQYYLAEMAKPEEISLTVTKADFEHALANLVPSVSEAEMAHYARIQGKFSNGNKMPE